MSFSLAARVVGVSAFVAAALVACGGGVSPVDGSSSGSSGSSGTVTADPCPPNPSGGACAQPTTRTPKDHRATATVCEVKKPAENPYIPEAGTGAPTDCHSNAECTTGRNGRCDGNPHDGYRCTYDECYADDECGSKGVCSCNGATRATNNVCIEGDCRIDADCGSGGFCSPTLGSCGHYGKAVAYYCHTAQDECVDDDDCAASVPGAQKGYCAYEKSVGRWKCSTNECVG